MTAIEELHAIYQHLEPNEDDKAWLTLARMTKRLLERAREEEAHEARERYPADGIVVIGDNGGDDYIERFYLVTGENEDGAVNRMLDAGLGETQVCGCSHDCCGHYFGGYPFIVGGSMGKFIVSRRWYANV